MLLHATAGSRVPTTTIIHPGFIKTGTTSLQEFLLHVHPQVHAFGHPHQSALGLYRQGNRGWSQAYGLPLHERGYAA